MVVLVIDATWGSPTVSRDLLFLSLPLSHLASLLLERNLLRPHLFYLRILMGRDIGVKLVNRRYVIDETIGAVDVFIDFASVPDSHEFRIEKGKIRYVHTITVMGG